MRLTTTGCMRRLARSSGIATDNTLHRRGDGETMTDTTIPNINCAAAADFLGSLVGDGRPVAVTPIGAGAWSQAYALSHDGRDYVARFAALREDFERDRIAAAFSSAALPVPRTVAIGEAFGGSYS